MAKSPADQIKSKINAAVSLRVKRHAELTSGPFRDRDDLLILYVKREPEGVALSDDWLKAIGTTKSIGATGDIQDHITKECFDVGGEALRAQNSELSKAQAMTAFIESPEGSLIYNVYARVPVGSTFEDRDVCKRASERLSDQVVEIAKVAERSEQEAPDLSLATKLYRVLKAHAA